MLRATNQIAKRLVLLSLLLLFSAALAQPEGIETAVECIKLPDGIGNLEFLDGRSCVFSTDHTNLLGYDIRNETVAWRTELKTPEAEADHKPTWRLHPLRTGILACCSWQSEMQFSMVDSISGKVTGPSDPIAGPGSSLIHDDRVLFESETCIVVRCDCAVIVLKKSDLTLLFRTSFHFPRTFGLVAGKSIFVLGGGQIQRVYDIENTRELQEVTPASSLSGDMLLVVDADERILALTRPDLTKDADWTWEHWATQFDVQTFDLKGKQVDCLKNVLSSESEGRNTRWLFASHMLIWPETTADEVGYSKYQVFDPKSSTLLLVDLGFACFPAREDGTGGFLYNLPGDRDHLGAYDVVEKRKKWEFAIGTDAFYGRSLGKVVITGKYIIGSGLQWVRRMKVEKSPPKP